MTANRVGDHVRCGRVAQGLSLGQLARRIGYSNLGRGTNRLRDLEATGECHPALLSKVITALGLDPAEVRRVQAQQEAERAAEFRAWQDQPTPMRLLFRLMAAVLQEVPLPPECDTAERAEAYACTMARERRQKACLTVSRRLRIWIEEDGRAYPEHITSPRQQGPAGLVFGDPA